MYLLFIKPIFDWIFALVLSLIFLPFAAVLAVILAFHFKSNPFFTQNRIGRNERKFLIYKFKTLKDGVETDEERSTSLGIFLRNTGIDEIPQLLNILKREMSFVGPRPLLTEYLPFYNRTTRARHNVMPGITGLAQIHGGNNLEWCKRFAYDLEYVQNISLALDAQIIKKTTFGLFKTKSGNIGKFKNPI